MTTKQEIALYTDGSVMHGDIPAMGAGWVAVAGDQVIRSDSRPLPQLATIKSSNANKLKWRLVEATELVAAALALHDLPDASLIRLHTDARNVRRYFMDPVFRAEAEGSKLKKYYSALGDAFARHTIVDVEMCDDAVHPRMRQAHLNAQSGAFTHRRDMLEKDEPTPIEWPPKLPPDAFDL